MSNPDPFRARIRMFRQGLGDCFLVTFSTPEGPVHAVIDCGTLGAQLTDVEMEEVVAHIAGETGGHLHLLIATHEHKDHVSGFGTEREAWDRFRVDRVWAAWTENPRDADAQAIHKHKGDLMEAVGLAARALGEVQGDADEVAAVRELRDGMTQLLGFFDEMPAAGEPFSALALARTVNEAMGYVTGRAGKDGVDFLEPGQVLEPNWLSGFRVYVLGPPRSKAALQNMGGHESPELYHAAGQLGGELAAAINFGASGKSFSDYRNAMDGETRASFEKRMPFDPRFRVETVDEVQCGERFPAYYEKESAWRRIDADWLTGAGELALQLDSYTNNTSLVLAVELIDDGRVLLFAADAQLGNWLSWHDHTFKVTEKGEVREVTAADLLRRAVFYKVGHHASHNATAREQGLELMESDDLVAMIALDHDVAIRKRPHPWHMPADALYRRLIERTQGRVLRSDIGWATDDDVRKVFTGDRLQEAMDARARARADVEIPRLYVDLYIR
ncbi:MAG TPA: hypothetical protein VFR37_02420 [Longimicrobium sp.]|nr:hypothetical protein [Longimicrobium sp.]